MASDRPRTKEVRLTSLEQAAQERLGADAERKKRARMILRREEVMFEPVVTQGVFVAGLVDRGLGFENRVLQMHLVALPPGGRTRSHRHGEAIVHVLKGRGYTLIDGVEYAWQRGDTLHLPSGVWHQPVNLDPGEFAYHIAISAAPLWEHLGHFEFIESAGDDYTDVGEFRPRNPWLEERVLEVTASETGERWMSSVHQHRHHRRREFEEERQQARIITRAEEVKFERSAHRGDYITSLADRSLGCANHLISLDMHVMPPNSHTETHRHWEAILHILRGQGYALIGGARYDWQTGDTLHIQEGVWHQIWNTDPERPSYILAAKTGPLFGYALPQRPEVKEGEEASPLDEAWLPANPWT